MTKPSKSIEQIRQEKFDELENLRIQQANGDTEKIQANKNDKYQINEHDKHMLHFRRVLKMNNPTLMKYDEFEDVQQFTPSFFDANKDNLVAGYAETEIIHDPRLEKKAKTEDAAGEAMSKIASKKE